MVVVALPSGMCFQTTTVASPEHMVSKLFAGTGGVNIHGGRFSVQRNKWSK